MGPIMGVDVDLRGCCRLPDERIAANIPQSVVLGCFRWHEHHEMNPSKSYSDIR